MIIVYPFFIVELKKILRRPLLTRRFKRKQWVPLLKSESDPLSCPGVTCVPAPPGREAVTTGALLQPCPGAEPCREPSTNYSHLASLDLKLKENNV